MSYYVSSHPGRNIEPDAYSRSKKNNLSYRSVNKIKHYLVQMLNQLFYFGEEVKEEKKVNFSIRPKINAKKYLSKINLICHITQYNDTIQKYMICKVKKTYIPGRM